MSTINLVTKFFPLAIFLYLFPPRVEVDGGEPQKISWGSNSLQVAPGQHHLKVYFPYLFIFRKTGKAEADVTATEGQTPTVTYKAPTWFMFLPGKMKVS